LRNQPTHQSLLKEILSQHRIRH